jgi:hypothetical protein
MQFKHIHIFLLALILLSTFTVAQNSKTINKFELLSTQTEYEVGSHIVLRFSTTAALKPFLYCSNSYGSTLLTPTFEGDKLQYSIPLNISKKTGVVTWKLINDDISLSGKFNLNPKQDVATMETYIGPTSIEAGGTDYTMLVVIPTDSLDNPVQTNILVNAKHQFLDAEESDEIYTNNLIAYKNIYSKTESGRMLVSSESLGTNSKEFTINIAAAIPTNFTISLKRPHEYADGNQITTFSTSVIRDNKKNVVSDGTFVTFFITNQKGNILKTSGITIEGIAQAKMIHPDFEDNWSVKAYVEGMAESNKITVNYKQVIKDFDVAFSKNNREITVGPLQSFMKQMIPDGLQVKLLVYKNETLIETYKRTSLNGYARFNLKPDIFKNDTYHLIIQTAGIQKTFKNKTLW